MAGEEFGPPLHLNAISIERRQCGSDRDGRRHPRCTPEELRRHS